MKREIYFSVDIEADGPCPGIFSMLSFGVVAYDDKGNELATLEYNLDKLVDHEGKELPADPATEIFWRDNEEAYKATRVDTVSPQYAMISLDEWVSAVCSTYNGKAVFVAYPAGFDFTFIYWYLIKFVGKSCFGFSSLDMKSYAMAKLNTSFGETTKRNFPKSWKNKKHRHNHIAIDDAREQGEQFFHMLKHVPATS